VGAKAMGSPMGGHLLSPARPWATKHSPWPVSVGGHPGGQWAAHGLAEVYHRYIIGYILVMKYPIIYRNLES